VTNNDIPSIIPGPTYCLVTNDFYVDDFVFYSETMDSTPTLGITVSAGIFFRDQIPPLSALSSIAIPTVLNLGDWDWYHWLRVSSTGNFDFVGTLTSLAPASVPSPSPSPIPPPPIPPGGAGVPEWCVGSQPIGLISDTLVCNDCIESGDGTFDCQAPGATCETKTAVERNIMEKSGDGSTYCYYTKTGQRVCKTI
jgi:hypothetical protein